MEESSSSSSTSQMAPPLEDVPATPPPHHGPIQATAEMCHYCFDLLLAHLRSPRTADRDVIPKFLRSNPSSAHWHCPVFVTWDKARPIGARSSRWLNGGSSAASASASASAAAAAAAAAASSSQRREEQHRESREQEQQHFELRGCIGTLSPKPLRTAIGEFAITSAFGDRRFNPISPHEVPHLRVAVSLLVNYEECRHCHDWIIGVHGIIITFYHGSSEYSATYLPEVAQEQG